MRIRKVKRTSELAQKSFSLKLSMKDTYMLRYMLNVSTLTDVKASPFNELSLSVEQ